MACQQPQEVGFAVDLEDHAYATLCAQIAAHDAFRCDAAGFLCGCRETFLAQIVLGFFKIAFTLGERFFAIHHADSSARAVPLRLLL